MLFIGMIKFANTTQSPCTNEEGSIGNYFPDVSVS